ncbi:MAG: hypothetical protein WC789_11810 [Lentisphaeria bacterium]|jgi:hypothetical protein
MTIGIGGAGGKLAIKLDQDALLVNVSEVEMGKLPARNKLLAVRHSVQGQLRGSRKNPQIGQDAYFSIREELLRLIRGNLVFSSTGGGTGCGICTALLQEISQGAEPALADRTRFAFVLPYAKQEPAEFVANTTQFLGGPLSEALDSGNTGNLILFSNRLKFESKLAEEEFNELMVTSLRTFLEIPRKNEELRLLDGHIDVEDFNLYTAKPYFNHFTTFEFDPGAPFDRQLAQNLNPLLLPPENPIEAIFLLEVPEGGDPRAFYNILDHFTGKEVTPIYSVVENPRLRKPSVTVSMLYSRKPAELVDDFNRISQEHVKAKVRKTVEQHVQLHRLEVNLEQEVKQLARQRGESDNDILVVLKRIGKL